MKPFDRSPLKDFIKSSKPKERTSWIPTNQESIILSLIILVFLAGIIFIIGDDITGRVTYGEEKIVIQEVNMIYENDTFIGFGTTENIVSVRVTGAFIGDIGSSIYVEGYEVIGPDYVPYEDDLLIGMVIGSGIDEQISEDSGNDTSLVQADNLTVASEDEVEVISQDNMTGDTTAEVGVSVEEPAGETPADEPFDEGNLLNIDANETEVLAEDENNSTQEQVEQETNISVVVNDTAIPELNVSEENITFPEDIIDNPAVNETAEPQMYAFEIYCEDSCRIDPPILASGIDVYVDSGSIRIDQIIYTYIEEHNETDEEVLPGNLTEEIDEIFPDASLNESANLTSGEENVSQNITLPVAENASVVNISEDINLTLEDMEEIMSNISVNDTFPSNLSEENLVMSEIDSYNISLSVSGITLLSYQNDSGIIKVHALTPYGDEAAYNLTETGVEVPGFIDMKDERLSGYAFRKAKDAVAVDWAAEYEYILSCSQIEGDLCKRWKKTGFSEQDIGQDIVPEGIYAPYSGQDSKTSIIPAKSVFYNSDCDGCSEISVCDASVFCAISNALEENINFVGQLDFDILSLDETWTRAEICAYNTYNSGQEQVNYIRSVPETHCSDIRQYDTPNEIIDFKVIEVDDTLVCIDISGQLRAVQEEGYSNYFAEWLGQDLEGSNFPIACYAGIGNTEVCGVEEQQAAGDCRPYLKINYD